MGSSSVIKCCRWYKQRVARHDTWVRQLSMDGHRFACQEDTAKGAGVGDSSWCSFDVCDKSAKLTAYET